MMMHVQLEERAKMEIQKNIAQTMMTDDKVKAQKQKELEDLDKGDDFDHHRKNEDLNKLIADDGEADSSQTSERQLSVADPTLEQMNSAEKNQLV
mmetsp:Transcript_29393/g.44418  ORF Transcript_29393/g.44418 Transcript_29393/m.44418 type:complete len:95 (-) Transcript_29393:391-675(-)